VDLYLQFGYGMMEHCRTLIKRWRSGTVILSPRDLSDLQLDSLSKDIRKAGGSVMLDPQLYIPESTNHGRLTSQSYWPPSRRFPTGAELIQTLNSLITLNRSIGADSLLLPGRIVKNIDDGWLASQQEVITAFNGLDSKSFKSFMTVALGQDVLKNQVQIHSLLDAIRGWKTDGIYLVCEHPNNEYFVDDTSWMSYFLDLIAGARLQGKQVVVGYCNQQMLLVGCSAANAIASGTWMNVRSFDESKFTVDEEESTKQRATWYYAPHVLSEYKLTFLQAAFSAGKLDLLRTPDVYDSQYADSLFTSPQPMVAKYSDQESFRHYLQCMKYQAGRARLSTFDETISAHERRLDSVESKLKVLRTAGILGQNRDFRDAVDIARSAIASLKRTRSATLKRNWASLI